jgi:L-aspartate oxidase
MRSDPDPSTVAAHEDANLLLLAEATAAAALTRTESIGAHHRIDARPPGETPTPQSRPSILETV